MLNHIPLGIKFVIPGLAISIFNYNIDILFWLGLLMITAGLITYNRKTIRRVSSLILFNIEFCCLLMAHAKSVEEYVEMINALFTFSIWTECKDKDYYPMDESICANNRYIR